MSKKKVDLKLENVTIEAVAAEGKALTHVDGMVVFVDFAVPGDVVDIQVFRKKKNYMEGFISRMIQPSPHRVEAFCEHFGVCGGCRWQPLPYEMQLEAKRQQVYDQLVRIGHLEVPEIRPTLPSQRTQFYRNKLEFSASSKRWVLRGEDPDAIPENDRMGLGFHVGKFFDKVLDIHKCWLQPEPSNAIRLFIKQFCIKNGYEFYDIRNNEGYFRNMFVRTTEAGAVMLILCFAYEDSEKRIALLDAVAAEFPQITSLWYVINEKLNDSIGDQSPILYKGDEAIYEEMEGLRFKIGPKSFYQTNSLQAYRLYSVARDCPVRFPPGFQGHRYRIRPRGHRGREGQCGSERHHELPVLRRRHEGCPEREVHRPARPARRHHPGPAPRGHPSRCGEGHPGRGPGPDGLRELQSGLPGPRPGHPLRRL